MNTEGGPLDRYPVEWVSRPHPGFAPSKLLDLELPGRGASSGPTQGLGDYRTIFVRHKWLVLFFAVLGTVAGWVFTALSKPLYQARTLLEIRGLNENFMNAREVDPNAGQTWEPSYLQTQIRILQTGALAERAAAALRAKQAANPKATPATHSWLRTKLGVLPPEAQTSFSEALSMARRTRHVRPLGTARIVEITSDSTDPHTAAAFANMLVHEFIEQNVELRGDTTQSTQEWLSNQLTDLKGKLEKSEEELQAYARDTGMLLGDDKGGADQAKLRSTQDELSRAEADRISKHAQYETAMGSTAESLPLELDDGSVRDNVAKLGDLRRQYAELSSTLTPEHYKVKRLAAQITEVEGNLRNGWARIVARLEKSYQGAARRQSYLESAYAEQYKRVAMLSAKSVDYNILRREVETNRQMYESTLQKVRGASIAAALRASNLRVVEPAQVPQSPYSPNPMRNMGMGLSAGLLLGMLTAALLVRTDHSLREPGDAKSYVHVPELGVIPSEAFDRTLQGRFRPPSFTGLRLTGAKRTTDGLSATTEMRDCVELITLQRRPSFVAESFRATMASILFSGNNGHSPRVLVIASPDRAEGKTTMVSNLGVALAEINRRVALIDGDMRNPSLHKVFDLANTWGLSDLLSERTSLADSPLEALVKRTKVPNLHVLPAGPATANVSSLLYSPRLAELLQRLRRDVDFVLIDTAPMLSVADARWFAKSADAVIMVFRAGSTTRQSAYEAVERLSADGSPLFGAILNDWSPTAGRHWYKDKYYYRTQRAEGN